MSVTDSAAVEHDEIELHSFVESAGVPGTVELVEADASGKSKGLKVDVVLIREGYGNAKDNHYYGGQALREALPLFNTGKVKMYINHLSDTQKRALGGLPRPVEQHGARLTKAWLGESPDSMVEDNGVMRPRLEIRGRALIAHPLLRDIVEADPEAIGTSIDARGRAQVAMREGRPARNVTQMTRVASTDFVTEAGANGRVDKIVESFIEAAQASPDDLYELATAEQGDDMGATELGRESEQTEDVVSDDELAVIEAELEALEEGEDEDVDEEFDEHAARAEHYERLAARHRQLAEADGHGNPTGTGARGAYDPFGSGATTTGPLEDAPGDELDAQGELKGGGVGRGTVGQMQGSNLAAPPVREGGYIDRRAGILELMEAGDVDGLEAFITEMAGELADQVIEETLEAGLAAARDEFERQVQDHDEHHKVDLEKVQQSYKAASIIDADPDLPNGPKQSLKEAFFDRHFTARKDGETEVSADDVLREAVSTAIAAKKSDLQEFKEARVTDMGSTTSPDAATATGSGRRARRGRGGADRRLDQELQIPDPKAKEQ
jgi:hypothetical protein